MKDKILVQLVNVWVPVVLLGISFDAPALAGSLPSTPTSLNQFIDLICRLAYWLFAFLIVAAVIFIIIAAWNYMLAAGDAEKVSTAHRMIAYTAVAIIVAVLARAIPFIVVNALLPGTNLGSNLDC